MVRVYDKIAEINQQSGKSFFFQLWGVENSVWRVEFQVRRARLKQGGINTLDDMQERQGDILRELAGVHTTLRVPTGDSNRSRWPLHPLWNALQLHVSRMMQTGLVRDIDPTQALEYLRYQFVRCVVGWPCGPR